METAIVSIMCIVLIVLGGMTMSQGFLTSADTAALGVEEISVRDGEIMRTHIDISHVTSLHWSDCLRIWMDNTGQTKLASFDKWDIIADYADAGGSRYITWLPYTSEAVSNNEWEETQLFVNGRAEVFEPEIFNPGEEMLAHALLNPPPGGVTSGNVTVSAPNGVGDIFSFTDLGYALLIPHSEIRYISSTPYFELREALAADGTAMTETTDAFGKSEVNRKILYDEDDPSRQARHIFSLAEISEIPAETWTVYYRCRTWGDDKFPNQNGDVNFDIDILIRQADGTIRTTIATNEADAYLTKDEAETWLTKSGTYDFPGYTVVDDSDYLEIVFYGETDQKGPQDGPGYMQIRIDDSGLAAADRTRIEA